MLDKVWRKGNPPELFAGMSIDRATVENNMEKETATHSTIFAWEIPPGKSHGWRSLVGCSPWRLEESDTTE